VTSATSECTARADGGTIMNDVDATGRPPVVTGPPAPPLATGDHLGWHETGRLPPHAMRRSRRMDVTPGPLASIDVLYRDSHVDEDGTESALSASRLAGQPVSGPRRHVRDTFLGTSTCTHLNALRSLEDIPALLKLAGR
jgi:hypothetical protein